MAINMRQPNSTSGSKGTIKLSDIQNAARTVTPGIKGTIKLSDLQNAQPAQTVQPVSKGTIRLTDIQSATAAYQKNKALDDARKQRKIDLDNEYYQKMNDKIASYESVKTNNDFSTYSQTGKQTLDAARSALAQKLANDKSPTFIKALKYGNQTDPRNGLTQNESDVYNYYVGKGQQKQADEYLASLGRILDERSAKKTAEQYRQKASENKVTGAIMNVTSGMSKIPALIDTAVQAARPGYTPANIYNSWQAPLLNDASIREGVTENMSDTGKKVYDFSVGMGQYATTLPFGPQGSLTLSSLQAAGGSANSAMANGSSPGQAFAYGTASGALNYITEKLPTENLFRIGKNALTAPGKIRIANILKQSGMEATEEAVQQVSQTILDRAINGQNSEYERYRANLIANGASEEEATKQANKEFFFTQVWQNAAGGAIGGGIMGGAFDVGGRMLNKANTPTQNTNTPAQTPATQSTAAVQPVKPLANVITQSSPSIAPSASQTATQPSKGTIKLSDIQASAQEYINNRDTGMSELLPAKVAPGSKGTIRLSDIQSAAQNATPNHDITPKLTKPEVNPQQGMKERGYSETIRTREDLPEDVKREFADNPAMYEQLSNKATEDRANRIMEYGVENARSQFDRLIEYKSPVTVVLGKKLAREYANQGNRQAAVDVLTKMSVNLTESGQFAQAAAIGLMKEDPMTALVYIQRQVESMNTEGREIYKKKWKTFELTDAEIEQMSNITPGDEESIKITMEAIQKRMAREYPASLWEKFINLRSISMLLNPRSILKNPLGNMVMLPLSATSRKVSAGLQQGYKLFNKDFQPTQSIVVSKKSKELARQSFAMQKDALTNVDKWNSSKRYAQKHKEVFKLSKMAFPTHLTNFIMKKLGKATLPKPILEYVREFTYSIYEKFDIPFLKYNYESRMASFIEAQKITDINDVPQEAIDYATLDALAATYRDNNKFSEWMSNAKNKSGILGETFIKFPKTPANITVRAMEYSPAGIAYALQNAGKRGIPLTIDYLAKGLTGSAIMFLGGMLFKYGFITGAPDKDTDKAAHEKAMGKIPYSIKFKGMYYSFDWAQPASVPLIVGAAIYEAITSQDALSALNVALSAGTTMIDTILEQSPLQNIKKAFSGYGSVSEKALRLVAETPLGLIPSVSGASARIEDPVVRMTYDKNNFAKTQVNSVAAKTLGLSKILPESVDVWGRTIIRPGNVGTRAFNELVNPGRMSTVKETVADKEILRLYDALPEKDNGIFPNTAPYDFKYQDVQYNLTPAEMSRYQRIQGTYSYDNVTKIINSKEYKDMAELEKAAAIKKIYDEAKHKARAVILKSKGIVYTGNLTKAQQEAFDELQKSTKIEGTKLNEILDGVSQLKPKEGYKTVTEKDKIQYFNTQFAKGIITYDQKNKIVNTLYPDTTVPKAEQDKLSDSRKSQYDNAALNKINREYLDLYEKQKTFIPQKEYYNSELKRYINALNLTVQQRDKLESYFKK